MFKAFLDMIGALFGAAANLGGKFVAVILTGLVCLGFWIFQTIRLSLWSNGAIATIAWLALLWLLVWMSASALILHQGVKLAAGLGTLSMAFIILQTVMCWAPRSSKGIVLVGQHLDKQAQQQAEKAVQEVPNKVQCDKSNYQRLVFFTTDGNTGERRSNFWYNLTEDGTYECYDRPGFDPVFGKPLEVVNDNIVRRIAQQSSPTESVPAEHMQSSVRAAVATQVPTPEPIPEPTPEPRREFVARAGQTFAVAINSMDLSKARENEPFTGTLSTDILTKHGLVIAKSGSPAEVMITSLQLDQNTGNALLEMRVTALTTVSGTVLPVQASDHDAPIIVRPVKSGLRRNGIRGLVIGTAAGTLAGVAKDGRRGALRGAGAGAVLGAGAGALLTRGTYILPTGHLRVTLDEPWVVPATLVASN